VSANDSWDHKTDPAGRDLDRHWRESSRGDWLRVEPENRKIERAGVRINYETLQLDIGNVPIKNRDSKSVLGAFGVEAAAMGSNEIVNCDPDFSRGLRHVEEAGIADLSGGARQS
jgi:hypothetical protein